MSMSTTYLVSVANGNLTSSSTWGVVDSTSLSDLNTGTTSTAVAGASSVAFTPGVITVSGIGIKIATRAAAPVGTVTVQLKQTNNNSMVAGTNVTVNGSDFYNVTVAGHGGWYILKFASPVTLLAATPYAVNISSSTGGTLTLYRSATVSDWSRMLVTSTNQAPIGGNSLLVAGYMTAPATYTNITVTQNDQGSNVYAQVYVNNYSTLSATVTGSNYLKVGYGTSIDTFGMCIFSGGTMTMGTSSFPMPAAYSSILEFQSSSAGLYGLDVKNGGTFYTYGAPKTQYGLLSGTVAAGVSSLTLSAAPAGWVAGDSIVVASTSVTTTQSELVPLSSVSSNIITCSTLSFAHSGVNITQAEVVNISKNVKIRGLNSTTETGELVIEIGGVAVLYNTESYFMGANVSNRYGAFTSLATTAGGGYGILMNCSLHDCGNTNGVGVFQNSATSTLTAINCNTYNTVSHGFYMYSNTNDGSNNLLSSCIAINTTGASSYGFYIQDNGTSVVNCRGISCITNGFLFSPPSIAVGTYNNLIAHSNGVGIALDTATAYTFTNLFIWNNNGTGFSFKPNSGTVTCTNGVIFGNSGVGLSISNGAVFGKYIFSNYNIYSNASVGIYFGSTNMESILLNNCTIGPLNVIGDIQIASANTILGAVFNNCTFNSTLFLGNQTYLSQGDLYYGLLFNGVNGIASDNRAYFKYYTVQSDTTIYNNASPSERITPNSATIKSRSSSKFVNLNSGESSTISVYVRNSNTTPYAGNAPRLVLKQNNIIGVTADTVLATSSAANGTWTTLTGTISAVTNTGVAEVYVDCDGTAGWINVDDWGVI